ncbi:multidrug efflux RND transporter permease subunit, partial [Escherichia coli]
KSGGGGFAAGFNARFRSLTVCYEDGLGAVLKRSERMLFLYVALCALLFLGISSLPSSFLPDEDQGYFMSSIQLPSDATMQRTLNVVKKFEEEIAARPDIESNIMILGFGFSGSGPNSAMAFTTLKDWKNRQGSTAQDEA